MTQHRDRGGPLAGVRVLAICKVWAGPYAAKMLSLLGAEVIKIESMGALDEMRAYGGVDIEHAPYFISQNTEILSARVNLKSDEGLGLLRKLIAKSDIVIDNLRPGALEKLGLAYADMKALKRDIIHVSIKMYGNEGPLGYQTGYAPSFAAIGGLNYLVGHEGRVPKGMNIRYGDTTAGAAAAFGAIAALHHREATGEGQFVDLSAVETISSLLGDSLLACSLTGESPQHHGNYSPDLAPHGANPCADDGWISIACDGNDEWRTLVRELGAPDIATDARFATHKMRLENRDALDRTISALTCLQDAVALADALRAAGIAAYPSASSLALISEDSFWSRNAFRMVENGNGDMRPVVGAPWRMDPDEADITHGAPTLGQHDDYVYRELLGLDEDAMNALIERKAIS